MNHTFVAVEFVTAGVPLDGVVIPPAINDVNLVTAFEIVKALYRQADILILLSHAGINVNRQIASQLHKVDLIISGGGQGFTPLPEIGESGPAVVHADSSSRGHAGRRIGVGTWHFDRSGNLTAHEWASLALTPSIADDPDMLAWMSRNP